MIVLLATAVLVDVGHVIEGAIAVAVVVSVIVADHFLPDSADEELRRWYRGQWKRRQRRGYTR